MKCIICGKEAGKFGNNAMPLIAGQCCNNCNLKFIIPLRIKFLHALIALENEVYKLQKENEYLQNKLNEKE